jgi:hypothetical protein
MSMKYSNETSGNKLATFRLLAQCFNQLRHSVPQLSERTNIISEHMLSEALSSHSQTCSFPTDIRRGKFELCVLDFNVRCEAAINNTNI